MPEIIADREAADESLEPIKPVFTPLDRTLALKVENVSDTKAVHFADGHRAHVHLGKGSDDLVPQLAEEIPVCPPLIKPIAAHLFNIRRLRAKVGCTRAYYRPLTKRIL